MGLSIDVITFSLGPVQCILNLLANHMGYRTEERYGISEMSRWIEKKAIRLVPHRERKHAELYYRRILPQKKVPACTDVQF